MIDPAKLTAFVLVTATASAVPGPQMIYVMTQTAWRGMRGGLVALMGLQLGNAGWYLLAALGLGTIARSLPLAFTLLTLAGAAYLAWLGIEAWRQAGAQQVEGEPVPVVATGLQGADLRFARPLRDSLVIAATNPKSLVYMVALLPPFVDTSQPIAPQLALLAAIGIGADVMVGTVYVAAGSGLARALARPGVRRRLDRTIGAVFLMLAAGICIDMGWRG